VRGGLRPRLAYVSPLPPRQFDDLRLGRRLDSIGAALGLKFKELFWTVTRAIGLGHLHDGSRSPATASASIPTAPTEILHNASADGSTDEIALARKRLAAVSSAERSSDCVRGGLRPRLAYVSPLPPDATGVADYSAELIPALSRHYEIDAFVVGTQQSSAAIAGCRSINDALLLEKSVRGYDRIVYNIGNSPFHQDYLPLVERFPGVVVMHDLYLGDLIYHMERQGDRNLWLRLLYHGHGYGAVAQLFREGGLASTIREYPGTLALLQQAQGFIVHNDYSLSLTRRFYGDTIAAKGALVPLGRALPAAVDRVAARRKLNIPHDEILVCSLGFLGKTKLNHRLLQIWVATGMAKRPDCRLVFVGQNGEDEYGQGIDRFIEICQLRNVFITGYCPPAVYREFLSATDIAVQLRADSRGETSGTVLDCMAYGVPTIVNREGSLCELPDDAIIKIPQAFSNPDLATPLKLLVDDAEHRAEIGSRARSAIEKDYGPRRSADLYHETIERFHQAAAPLFDMEALAKAAEGWDNKSEEQREETARGLVAKSRLPYPERQLLVDISALVREDMRSGIQRVARAQLLGLLKDAPAGFRVEPVYLESIAGSWTLFYARKYALRLLDVPNESLDDAPVAFNRGDVYYMPDLNAHAVSQAARDGVYADLRNAGVKIAFVVYDILPILRPEFFPAGANETHRAWLEVVAANADLLICISKTVMDETRAWLMRGKGGDAKLPNLTFLHLGADIDASKATTGLPADADRILTALQERPTFLLVGTVEPRKGYRQALGAFERLWRDGVDVNLTIVGSEGWKGLRRDERRTIPEIVDRITNSPEKDKRLFWLQGASDEFLDRVYPAATCLIAASEDEGFGLPLIEAARKGVPILARDIPVFREVVGEHAAYFRGETEADLAKAVCDLLADFRMGVQPRPQNIPWLTWSQQVSKLKAMLTQMESRPS
jgi:glycosyltransferase involved in cell wall biosynthesis